MHIALTVVKKSSNQFNMECNFMSKAFTASVIAIILGYIGSALGDAIINWPQLGPILAIVVMGSAILTSLGKDK